MAVQTPFVEGPRFASLVRETENVVKTLSKNGWDFDAAPQVYAKDSRADVLAKEMIHIFDGRRVTRVGRLVMGGVGQAFNLMGPIPADSSIRVADASILDSVADQLGCSTKFEHPDFGALDCAEHVEFFNYGTFQSLREMVHWLLVHDTGCFPSTLQHVVREFARGRVVQNYLYRPSRTPRDPSVPHVMQAQCLMFSFPSSVMEWMDRPLYGGLAKNTVHAETLLTTEPSCVSHPHLPLVEEGVVEFGHQVYHARRFEGITPKDGVRGPGVAAEAAEKEA